MNNWRAVVVLTLAAGLPALGAQDAEENVGSLQERERAVLEALDRNDSTCDGEGVGGWTVRDLPADLRAAFRSLTDAERASYYVLELELARVAMGEHAIVPDDPIGFEMQAEFVKRGKKVVGIRMWGKCKAIERRMNIYVRMRFPDPDASGSLMSWKGRVKEDGTWEVNADLHGRQLRYGHYFITGIADPRNVPEAGERYVERVVTDKHGRSYPLYSVGFHRRVLTHGTVEQISAEEVALRRFYLTILDRNVLETYAEFQERYRAFMEEDEGLREEVIRGPSVTPGPVKEEVEVIFDPSAWRAYLDEEFRPFLLANAECLETLRAGYVAPRFPRVMDTLLLALRDLDEMTRRMSQRLYERNGLPPDPRDEGRFFRNQPDPLAWQRRFEVSILALQRMGIRELSVVALERQLSDAGWEPIDLGVTVPGR